PAKHVSATVRGNGVASGYIVNDGDGFGGISGHNMAIGREWTPPGIAGTIGRGVRAGNLLVENCAVSDITLEAIEKDGLRRGNDRRRGRRGETIGPGELLGRGGGVV